MELKKHVMQRVVMPAGLKYLQWRGDPLARLLHPKWRADPYPLYAEVRERGLVQTAMGVVAVGRHDALSAILRDTDRFGHDMTRLRKPPPAAPVLTPDDPRYLVPSQSDFLLMQDPPDHTRVRRLVGKAFTPKAIASMEEWIDEVADGLVGGVARSGEMDLIEDVAFPLPLTVICRMLGVPLDDQKQFRDWGEMVGAGLDFQMTDAAVERSNKAGFELTEYLLALIDEHRASPRDDLLSALIAAEEAGDQLSTKELIGTCMLLLVAGFETTVNLIGNGMRELLRHPSELAVVRDGVAAGDSALVAGAVEEMLRFDSPVQLTSRVSYEEVTVGDGVTVPAGVEVVCLLGAANRDPAVFGADADRFDVRRESASRHVAFSTGIHHCLGAALARMEARAAVRSLMRLDGLELAGEPVRRKLMVLRGYSSLPVRFSAASSVVAA